MRRYLKKQPVRNTQIQNQKKSRKGEMISYEYSDQ